MSWDVMLMKFPKGFDGDLENLPHDWEPTNLSRLDKFVKEIKKIFPDIDDNDKTWPVLTTKKFSIEFNIGDDDPITSVTLHVRGGNEAINSIKLICKKFKCQAVDTIESKIIDFSKKTDKGFTQWRKYRSKTCQDKDE